MQIEERETHEATAAGESGWHGWLREVAVGGDDPAAVAAYYAELLGGEAAANAVALGSGTRIVVEEGAPGLRRARLDVAGTVDLSAYAPFRDDDGAVVDPDGWRLDLNAVESVDPPAADPVPRLGHVTFQSPDPLAQERFLQGLGFRLSEALGDLFRWLRCSPVHHTFAYTRAPAPRVHHIAVELPDRVALVDACDRLASLGHAVEYGPGRHLVGGNLFVYFRDRYGVRFELFCELRRIEEDGFVPTVYREEDRVRSVNVWGPQPPESFRDGF
jgi:catechol 2,3-dioxygenase-like lactoylglutathione lyase family enzyme